MRPSPQHAHPWDITPREAAELQRRMAGNVRIQPLDRQIATVAGLDVSIRAGMARAAVVVLEAHSLEVIHHDASEAPVQFPYVPGLLSFREMPAIIPLLERLEAAPDLFITDSQGLAHPRRFGLACHLGVYYDVPTMGVAKTRLLGTHDDPGPERGEATDLSDGDEVIGRVLRTRTNVSPVFVSVGHRITLDEAVAMTLQCAPRYRLPEATRLAHRLSKEGRL